MNLLRLTKYPAYLARLWWTGCARLKFAEIGITLGAQVRFHGVPIVTCIADSTIWVGDRVGLCSHSRHTALGVARPVILRTLCAGATIEIGDDSGLSATTICAARAVKIGRRCLIGADVVIMDTDFHPLSPVGRRYSGMTNARVSPVEIEDDVFIGTRAIVLPGVRVGKGAVIGAGAVVTRDVPANAICAGNPARVIRSIELVS